MAVLIGRFNHANLYTKHVADYKEQMIREAMVSFANAMREQGCLDIEENIDKSIIPDTVDVDIIIKGVVIGLGDYKELYDIAENMRKYENMHPELRKHISQLNDLINKLR